MNSARTEGYRTRIAPSPTGDMHLGTARTAYFNWLAARATNGSFLLRIDDTDADRNRSECVDVILRTMDYLGLDYDDMFYQSEKRGRLDRALTALVMGGWARRLDNGAFALNLPENMPRSWHDEIAGDIQITDMNIGCITGEHKNEGKPALLILARADGGYTYQFASAYDDWAKKINYIIRGTDHISNTFKQLAIWTALNQCYPGFYEPYPKFAHVGLIMKDKKKLSKRDGASSMLEYMKQGIDQEAMLNFMLRLGWSPSDPDMNGLIPRAQALQFFLTQGRMRNTNANMDPAKLAFLDKQYKKAALRAA